jgi:hypothetical protein
MGMSSDDFSISESAICRLADASRQTRDRWAKKRLLRKRPQDQYGLLDLLELTACRLLHESLGPTEGRDAWRQVRAYLGAQVPSPGLEVVFCEANHEATVVATDSALCKLVRQGLPIRVIPVGAELCRARASFDRYRAGRLADAEDPLATPSDQGASGNPARGETLA